MAMDKKELRHYLKQKRLVLSEIDRKRLSQKICEQLQKCDWTNIRSLHCFQPIKSLAEVDIVPFVESLISHYAQIKVYAPKFINNSWEMVHWQDNTIMKDLQFDAIVVPMLGFDDGLHRLGYGGGYYDRFLAGQTHARKIGVCFELGKVKHIPSEPHDVRLDSIVTESNIYLPPSSM